MRVAINTSGTSTDSPEVYRVVIDDALHIDEAATQWLRAEDAASAGVNY
jgi:hypothetical protein